MEALVIFINHFVNFDFLVGFVLGGGFALVGCFIFYKNERNFFKNEREIFLQERKQNQEDLFHQQEVLLMERKQNQEALLMQQERYEREIKRLEREIATLMVQQGAGVVK